MKKALLFLLLLVYTLSSTGATINLHFCCGELDSVSLSAQKKDDCEKSGMGLSKERCCDNKHVELKVKTDQEPALKWVQTQRVVCVPFVKPLVQNPVMVQMVPLHRLPNGPPESFSSLPLFIQHRVFRI